MHYLERSNFVPFLVFSLHLPQLWTRGCTSCIILTYFTVISQYNSQPGHMDQCKKEQDVPSSRLKLTVTFCQLIMAGLTIPGQQQRQLLNRKRISTGLNYKHPFSWSQVNLTPDCTNFCLSGRGYEPRLYRQIWISLFLPLQTVALAWKRYSIPLAL